MVRTPQPSLWLWGVGEGRPLRASRACEGCGQMEGPGPDAGCFAPRLHERARGCSELAAWYPFAKGSGLTAWLGVLSAIPAALSVLPLLPFR